jgi:hypothetical protein
MREAEIEEVREVFRSEFILSNYSRGLLFFLIWMSSGAQFLLNWDWNFVVFFMSGWWQE